MSEADLRGHGRKPEAARVGGSNFPGGEEQSGSREPDLIERMLERGNMLRAMQAVIANGGAAGVDGMEVGELREYLLKHWAGLKEQILNGSYEPSQCGEWTYPSPVEARACWGFRRSLIV